MSDISDRIAKLSPEKRELLLQQLKNKQGRKVSRSPITPRKRDTNTFPLSFAQQRLWFLDQLEPGSSAYNMPLVLRMTGDLDVAALEQSFCEIILRHEALRTIFVSEHGQPRQVILPAAGFTLYREDLSALPTEQRDIQVKQFIKEESSRPFDLAAGPLLRASLVRLSHEEQVLVSTVHHIVSDGWSMGVFYREFSALYIGYSLGKPAMLSELPIQYADFSEWQRGWLQGDVLEQQLSYWREQLANPPVLDLPTNTRPAVQTYSGSMHSFILSKTVTQAIKSLSRNEGVTLFMTLLATFNVLLFRYSAQEDLLVGTPIANRNRTELEGLIGFFVNTLVLRSDLSGNPSFTELLSRVRDAALSAYTHQDLPFEKLVKELQVDRDLSRSPLFQVMFLLQNTSAENLALDEVTISRMDVDTNLAKFDLTLGFTEHGEALKGWFEYNTDLFEPETIERMASHYQTILDGIVANPDQRLSELPLLTEAEHHRLLVEWNSERSVYPANKTIHHLFEEWATKTPDVPAVIMEGEAYNYLELNIRANKLAHHLMSMGIGPEDRVGICLERSIDVITSMLAVLKAGGTYVPIDPIYPQDRIGYMLEDADVRGVITWQRLVASLPSSSIPMVILDTDLSDIAQKSVSNPSIGVSPENLAYVIYTSGSTGRPKGVMISHHNVVAFLFSYQLVTGDKRRIGTSVAPFTFDTSVDEIYSALCFGGTLHILQSDQFTDARFFANYLIDHKITTCYILPDFLSEVAVHLKKMHGHLQLKCLITGLKPKKMGQLQKFRELSSGLKILNAYGPTEVTYGATAFEFEQADDPDQNVPIGRPFPNYEVYVVDQNLQPVPIGVKGELLIGGKSLARGYLNMEELTAAKFIPHPFSLDPHARVYRTGDLVCYRPDGNLDFFGRIDDQVKIRGFRVEPGEIEKVLQLYPDVNDDVVVARDDMRGDKCLVAYVVLSQAVEATSRKLRGFLKTKLPDYMLPSAFVVLDVFPLMSNGKVDRSLLPEPEPERLDLKDTFVEPRTPIETLLAAIWSEVFRIEPVGINDNFFELGGHSLLAIMIISRIRNTFMVDLQLQVIFENPTIAELALIINKNTSGGDLNSFPSIVHVRRDGGIPLSFAQEQLWFINELHPGNLAYNFEAALWFKGKLNIEALERSLNAILQRHEIYRTTFPAKEGQPFQVIHDYQPVKLEFLDLGGSKESKRVAMAKRIIAEEYRVTFNLTQLPLVRWKLLRISNEEHVLIHLEHHLVHDGWSFNVFLGELNELYNAFYAGKSSPLQEPQIQFADFACWQRQWMQKQVLEKQLTYWKNHLSGYEQGVDLPIDHPRPQMQTFNGKQLRVELPLELCDALRSLSRSVGVSLYISMLSGFFALISRYSGKTDLCIGTGVANRRLPELEGVLGLIVNTLAIRTNLSGNPSFLTLVKRVREGCFGAYANQDIPLEKIVEAMQPDRILSNSPFYQLMFSFHDSPLSDMDFVGLETELVEGLSQGAKADLNIIAIPRSEQSVGHGKAVVKRGITLLWEYNTDIFESSTINRMAGHYQRILEGAVSNSCQKLSELSLLKESERHHLIVGWNNLDTKTHVDECIHNLFEKQAKDNPDTIAIALGDQQLTYQELNSKANQLANYLKKYRVGPEVSVALYFERSIEMVIGILGILKAGGVYVPLGPEYPEDRLSFMVQDTKAQVLLTHEKLQDIPCGFQGKVVYLDTDWSEISLESEENPESGADPDNLAYIMYTSGSTGRPKGVEITHRGVVRLVCGQDYISFHAAQRFLLLASISFDASTFELWGALLHGASCIIYPERYPSVPVLERLIVQHSITTLWLTSALFNLIIDEAPEILTPIKQLITGGEALSVAHVRRAQKKLPHIRFVNGYGPTEGTTFSCCYPIPDDFQDTAASVPIGKPINNTVTYLLGQDMEPVAIGVLGELYVGGAGVARGYLNSPQLTEEKFIPHPFSDDPRERLYKTGDMARYLPDGNIEFLGRIDHQVKIRGFRIELGEIETTMSAHPGILNCVVIARDDHAGGKQLVAYFVASPDNSPTSRELHPFLASRLPDYMIPAHFIAIEALPLTLNGKVDRNGLPDPDENSLARGSFVPPRNIVEESLVTLWADVLNNQKISIHDNFFDLGGHSLLATQLMSRTRELFQVEIPLRRLFEAPTVAGFAQIITESGLATQETQGSEEKSGPAKTLVPMQIDGPRPPFFWVHGIGQFLLPYLEPDQPVYGLTHQGMDGLRARYTTTRELTAHYIEQMRDVQPVGPYYLGGFCSGGASAHHIARQLIDQGEDVGLLLLVAPERFYGNPVADSDGQWSSPGIVSDFFSRYAAKIGAQQTFSGKMGWVAKSAQEIVRWICRDYIYFPVIFPVLCEMYFRTGRPLPVSMRSDYIYKVLHRKVRADYVRQPYQKDIIVIEMQGVVPWDWSSTTTGNITTHLIESVAHEDVVKEPHVGPWAKLLSMYLKDKQMDHAGKGE